MGIRGKAKRPPSYRHHRASGMGVVTINGQGFYLGVWNTKRSRADYDRLVGEYLTAGRITPKRDGGGTTIVEIVAPYLKHAKQYYVNKDGTPTNEAENAALAMRPLRRLYGRTDAANFGPLALQSVRTAMIADGLSRGEINKRINHIRRMFKWAVARELVDASVLQALRAVAGLRIGRSQAPETPPVLPVPESDIDAVREHVSPTIWAMIQIQLLTACRAGELIGMRPCDIDVGGKTWVYQPPSHKTSWRGKARTIHLGPRARQIIEPLLADRPIDGFLFSPRAAAAARNAGAATHRRPKQRPNAKKTNRVVGEVYTVASYRRAIHYACKLADVPIWAPGRLRHNAATSLRKEHGLEAASLVLGHGSAVLTDHVYAQRDEAKVIAVVESVG